MDNYILPNEEEIMELDEDDSDDCLFHPSQVIYEDWSDLDDEDYILPDSLDDMHMNSTLDEYLTTGSKENNKNLNEEQSSDICDIDGFSVGSDDNDLNLVENFDATKENNSNHDDPHESINKNEENSTNYLNNHRDYLNYDSEENSDGDINEINMNCEEVLSLMIPKDFETENKKNNDDALYCQGKINFYYSYTVNNQLFM